MTTKRRTTLLLELVAVVVATWAAYWFAVGFGYNYGLDNQTTYLIGALKLYDPTLLTEDWVASQCTPYHPVFSYVGYLLMKLDPTGWSFGYANVAILTLAGVTIYSLCRLIAGRNLGLAVFFVVLAINAHTRTHSVGVSYILDFILQPSTLGGLGWLLALAFFLRGRWFASGLALAIGGLFHANYLVLGFPVFGFALLLVEDRRDLRALGVRLLKLLGPSLVIFLLMAPLILAAAADHPQADKARELFFHFRSPHHYVPLGYKGRFMRFAAWQALGLGAGLPLLRGKSGIGPRLGALLAGLTTLVWVGTFLTTWTFVPSVAQLFVWRVAPYIDLLCQAAAATAAARIIVRPDRVNEYPRVAIPLVLGGLVVLCMSLGKSDHGWIPRVLLAMLGAVGVAVPLGLGFGTLMKRTAPAEMALPLRFNPFSHIALACLIPAAGYLWFEATASQRTASYIKSHSTLIEGFDRHEEALYAWIREHTPKTARFLQPPFMERFRFAAERAIVVDWKSPPLLPGEFLEWYDRLGKVAGVNEPKSAGTIGSGYARLDRSRLERLKSEYGIDFVVVDAGRERSLRDYPVVYRNPRYVVLDVRNEPKAHRR